MECGRRPLLIAAALGLTGPVLVQESASARGRAVVACRDVPVGGGVIVADRGVVVTRPKRRRFRVFSAYCTHAGCLVSTVAERRIGCACHGSEFAIGSGKAVAGPANSPLPPREFEIRRRRIFLT